jgi:methyl-accepting chemotaxis protein
MYRNQKIRFRILLGYSVPLFLFILVALAVYASLGSYAKVHDNAKRGNAIVNWSSELSFNVAKMQRAVRGYLIYKNEALRTSYNEASKLIDKTIQTISPLIKDEKQKELLGKILLQIDAVRKVTGNFILLVDKGQKDKAIALFRGGESQKLASDLDDMTDKFEKKEAELYETWIKEEDRALGKIGISLTIGILLTLTLSVIIGLLVANGITKHVAGAINAMASTSAEIAATVNQHERTAFQQASMVNEMTTTIEELGASSQQTSEQASSAAEVARKSTSIIGEGTVIVKQAIEGMNSLGAKVGMIADQTLKLGEQTAQIGNLANMVKDLSGEINMLALNAAVEAARAGEHGKGFAVVAGEVRKLANESKKSAEQANVVIADIQKATNATILRTEEGTKVVEEVTAHARNVGLLFNTLAEAADKAYENAQQVLLNAKQQAMAIGQVVEAMNGLNTGARETAAGIVQTKTGIEQLNSAAVNLKLIL